MPADVTNDLRQARERLRISQSALSKRIGISRQSLSNIEAGRQTPNTAIALRLARVLGCSVEDLFRLPSAAGMDVRLAPSSRPHAGARVALSLLRGAWVAHRLPSDATVGADGIFDDATGTVAPLVPDPAGRLARNVLVAGCAPLLGALSQRVSSRFDDARVTWLPASSHQALDLLKQGLVHAAGLHLDDGTGRDNVAAVRAAFPNTAMLIVHLTRWRQGFVVPAGNPMDIRTGADLLQPGLRLAQRDPGAGATRLVERLLYTEGAVNRALPGPRAHGHRDVAQLVRYGSADVGIAIEGVALAAGLDFVPLAEERFDLVIPADLASAPPVSRLIEALDDPGFRVDAKQLPGYDTELSGHVITLEAA